MDKELFELEGDELEAYLVDYNKRATEEAKKRDSAYRYARRYQHEISCIGHFERDDIEKIWHLQGSECYFCGTKLGSLDEKLAFSRDHLIPVSDFNGSHWPHNIGLVCAPCNSDKQGRTERSYWMKLEKKNGKDSVLDLKERAKTNKNAKKKLTSLRKKDRLAGIVFLQESVIEQVAQLIDHNRHDCTPIVEIIDRSESQHIDIHCEEVAVQFLGPKAGLKSAQVWFKRNGKHVVESLVALDNLNPKRRLV